MGMLATEKLIRTVHCGDCDDDGQHCVTERSTVEHDHDHTG
jgi:hypothetical protein